MMAELEAPQASGGGPVAFDIGDTVVFRSTLGEEVSGSVFAFDKPSNVLVLREAGAHSGVANLRLLKASCVGKVLLVRKPTQPVDLRLPYVDVERCRKREEKAMQQAEVDASRVGVGVTKEAQAIFDAIVKTMPCVWRGRTIVVLDCVQIDDPYTPDSCASHEDQRSTRERVKTVLRNERDRLGLAS